MEEVKGSIVYYISCNCPECKYESQFASNIKEEVYEVIQCPLCGIFFKVVGVE